MHGALCTSLNGMIRIRRFDPMPQKWFGEKRAEATAHNLSLPPSFPFPVLSESSYEYSNQCLCLTGRHESLKKWSVASIGFSFQTADQGLHKRAVLSECFADRVVVQQKYAEQKNICMTASSCTCLAHFVEGLHSHRYQKEVHLCRSKTPDTIRSSQKSLGSPASRLLQLCHHARVSCNELHCAFAVSKSGEQVGTPWYTKLKMKDVEG
eukprot:Sspe_Gene.75929::Locus_47442_Transcript_1_1_Confidence_1.000_Length_5064::g.75929::m.75929